jgi:hypothetical protein
MDMAVLARAALLAAATAALSPAAWAAGETPAWTLVVPVHRLPDGNVAFWEREDAWSKAWRIPGGQGGLRTVEVTGDSEDKAETTWAMMEAMDRAALWRLSEKYGAPSISVVTLEGDAVTVNAWSGGRISGESSVAVDPSDMAAARATATELMAAVIEDLHAASGEKAADDGEEDEAAPEMDRDPVKVSVVSRIDIDGGWEYRLAVPAEDAERAAELLGSIQGLAVSGRETVGDQTYFEATYFPERKETLEDALR